MTLEQINKTYTDNADKVFRYFYSRIENRALAEDLTSQTFIKFLDKIEQFDEKKASVVTWLFTIAKNLLIDYFRSSTAKAAKNKNDIEDAEEFIDPSNPGNKDLETFVQSVRNKKIVDKELEILNEDERLLIFLKYTQDLSYEEIAKEVDSSVNAVGVKLHRIVNKLRNHMQKTGAIDKIDR